MARRQRIDFEGAIHHVFGRGNHKQPIFLTDSDRSRFLHRLISLRDECGFTLYAYCLMSNHYHLLIQTGRVSLSRTMHRLLTGYSIRFNEQSSSMGHVFQGRYGDRLCKDDAYFLWLIRYIHMNPVDAEMVRDPSDWLWSSHRDYLSGKSAIVEIKRGLSMFADANDYLTFLRRREDPIEEEDLHALGERIARQSGIELDALRQRGGRVISAARRLLAQEAAKRGLQQSEIAAFLNCGQAAVSHLVKSDI